MKLQILFILFLLAPSQMLPQKISWGAKEKYGGGSAPAAFIQIDSEGYFAVLNRQFSEEFNPFQLNTSPAKFNLIRFSNAGKEIYKKNFAEDLGKEEKFPAIFSAGSNLYLSTAVFKDGRLSFFYRKIKPETGELIGEAQVYAAIVVPNEKPYCTFKEIKSPDGSKTLILLNIGKKRLIRKVKTLTDGDFHVAIFDSRKGLIWNKNLTPGEREIDKSGKFEFTYPSEFSQVYLDSLGQFHLVRVDGSSVYSNENDNHAQLISYDSTGTAFRRIELSDPEFKGYNFFDFDTKGELMMVKLPEASKPQLRIAYVGPKDLNTSPPITIKLAMKDQHIFENEWLFGSLKVLRNDDGSKILIQEYCNYEEVFLGYSEYPICTDLKLIKLSSKGDIMWTHSIEKKQFIPSKPELYSFFYTNIDDDLIIIFNNEYSNVHRSKGKLVQVRIDAEGKKERKIIHDAKDPALLMVPTKSFKSNEKQISLLTRWKTEYRILRLDY